MKKEEFVKFCETYKKQEETSTLLYKSGIDTLEFDNNLYECISILLRVSFSQLQVDTLYDFILGGWDGTWFDKDNIKQKKVENFEDLYDHLMEEYNE